MSKFNLHIGHETTEHETRDNCGFVPCPVVSRLMSMDYAVLL